MGTKPAPTRRLLVIVGCRMRQLFRSVAGRPLAGQLGGRARLRIRLPAPVVCRDPVRCLRGTAGLQPGCCAVQEGRPKHHVVMELMKTVASSPTVRYLLWMECFALVTRPQQNFPFHGKYERLGKLIIMWVASPLPPSVPRVHIHKHPLCLSKSTRDVTCEAHDYLCCAHVTELHAELRPTTRSLQ